MASPRPWPLDDDEDRPSGSVRPLSQADLQAILAHLNNDRDELLSGTSGGFPVVAVRVRASVGRPGGSARAQWRRMRAAEWTAWTRTLPWRIAVIVGVGAVGGLLGGLLTPRLRLVVGGLAAVAAGWGLRFRSSPSCQGMAAGRGGGATHRPAAGPAGAARLGGPARPGRPRQPGQPRSLDHWPRWGVRDRLQALSRPPAARPIRAAVARPLPTGPNPAGGVVRGRPGRPGSARPGHGRCTDRGRPRRPDPLGQGGHARRAGGVGPALAKHALNRHGFDAASL